MPAARLQQLHPGRRVPDHAANALTADQTNPLFQVQTGEVRVRGLELEGVASLRRGLNLIGAVTYLDPEVTKSTVPAEVGTRPAGVPKVSASLYLDQTFGEGNGIWTGFGIGAGIRFISNSASSIGEHQVVPSATLVDASARYDLGRLSRFLEKMQSR